jgi:hypothetical protein
MQQGEEQIEQAYEARGTDTACYKNKAVSLKRRKNVIPSAVGRRILHEFPYHSDVIDAVQHFVPNDVAANQSFRFRQAT